MTNSKKINLGIETRTAIVKSGHKEGDILWIGNNDFYVDTIEFFNYADNYNYDRGYGHHQVPLDLKIVFYDNSWLERYEYDGSEHWVFKQSPFFPREKRKLKPFEDNAYWLKLTDWTFYEA